jgi:hypothetical protein
MMRVYANKITKSGRGVNMCSSGGFSGNGYICHSGSSSSGLSDFNSSGTSFSVSFKNTLGISRRVKN